jgi:hypothetical protein
LRPLVSTRRFSKLDSPTTPKQRKGVANISEENSGTAETVRNIAVKKAVVWVVTTPQGWCAALTAFVCTFLAAVIMAAGHQASAAAACEDTVSGGTPTALAQNEIPADYLQDAHDAEQKTNVPWNVLMGISKIESNFGRLVAQGVKSGANFAGAAGPMQILVGGPNGNTWGGAPRHRVEDHAGGYASDGNGDGWEDVYDPADAILGAAKYLKANGAPADLHKAIFAYNHAEWYVAQVMNNAKAYASGDFTVAPGVSDSSCAPVGDGNLPTGDAQDLAKAILANPKIITDGRLVYFDLHQQAQGDMPSNDVALKASLLAVLSYVGKSIEIHVSALESGGTGHIVGSAHYDGRGADINIINGSHTTGRDANAQAVLALILPVLPKGSKVGQEGCGPDVQMPPGVIPITDTCNHLHIQVPS